MCYSRIPLNIFLAIVVPFEIKLRGGDLVSRIVPNGSGGNGDDAFSAYLEKLPVLAGGLLTADGGYLGAPAGIVDRIAALRAVEQRVIVGHDLALILRGGIGGISERRNRLDQAAAGVVLVLRPLPVEVDILGHLPVAVCGDVGIIFVSCCALVRSAVVPIFGDDLVAEIKYLV